MTALRTRFIEDMQLHGYSPKTQSCYVGAVCGLAKHYHKSPDLISEEELRRYFLHLTLQKKVARATATIALCGIKFLFQNTLQRNWTSFNLLRPPREKKLPVVLSRQEVQRILACVRTPMYRVCLTTIYSCGLRLSEGLFLRIPDVDSQRMLLRIRGKGNKDRFVPLPQRTLEHLLTFTLPAPIRSLAYAQQKALYGLLLSSAAAALQKLAWDPRYVGGRLAMLAVLHTWTRAMLYHPHVHLLVSAGGLAKDRQHWISARHPAFLVPGFALSQIFRGKFRVGLRKLGLLGQVPSAVWQQNWVVHCQHAGQGQKVLDYLARYVFRIAITHSRIEGFEQGRVTFRYRDNRSQQLQRVNVPAEEFIRRFLLHVLPRGLVKVRSYGLFSAHCPEQLEQDRSLLALESPDAQPAASPLLQQLSSPSETLRLCPRCKIGHLVLVASLLPQQTGGP